MIRRGVVDLVLAAAFVCSYFAAAGRLVRPVPFGYDESDYMVAASKGFRANWLDEPSIGIREFIRTGSNASHGAATSSSISASIRATGDALFYRHWHGPLYFYALIAAAPSLRSDEQNMRRVTLVFPALTFLITALLLRTMAGGRVTAALFGLLFLTSFSTLRTAAMMVPHSLFVLLAVSTLICLAKLADSRRLRWWYGAVLTAALALATLEIAIVLVPVMAVFCRIERRTVFRGWSAREWVRFASQSTGLFIVVLTAVWPAGIWKLSLVKAWAFMAYLALFRKGAWGDVTFAGSWWQRLTASPVEWLVIASAFVVFAWRGRKPRAAWPALLGGATMLAAVVRVLSTDPRYMTAYLPALLLFTAVALGYAAAELPPARSVLLCAGLGAALIWSSARQFPVRSPQVIKGTWTLIDFVRQRQLQSTRMLVPQVALPALHYYFPQAQLRPYSTPDEAAALGRSGNFDGVLSADPVPRFDALRRP